MINPTSPTTFTATTKFPHHQNETTSFHHSTKSATASALLADNHLHGHTPSKLKYAIHSCSSSAPSYPPNNILLNKPHDQASRWTSLASDQAQFMLIMLNEPAAIVTHLVFGKYHKPHVCNLKEFRVFCGIHVDKLVEVFHGGLENSPDVETVALRHRTPSTLTPFPVKYIKIVPHASFQREFPYSIWYLEVHGVSDCALVSHSLDLINSYRERELVRSCLKYFRQRNYLKAFNALSQDANQQVLEDPLLSQLHTMIVHEKNYLLAEQLVRSAASQGMMHEYITNANWTPIWMPVSSSSVYTEKPGPRGGHQLFLDDKLDILYLFGGWDGHQELADLWAFNLNDRSWTLVCNFQNNDCCPSPRSCHKICVDPVGRCAYLLGRYIDTSELLQLDHQQQNSSDNLSLIDTLVSDFWKFDLDALVWTRIFENTAVEDGPSLVYDHQMAMDSDQGILYVFGGRTVTIDASVTLYSGLYGYNIKDSTWKLYRHDSSAQELKPRVSHAMMFHPPTKQLLILGGQRTSKELYNHFLAYDTIRDKVSKLPTSGAPDTGLTQRAVYDTVTNSVLVLSNAVQRPISHGSSQPHDPPSSANSLVSPVSPTSICHISNSGTSTSSSSAMSMSDSACGSVPSVWQYRLNEGVWKCIPLPRHTAPPSEQPCPRFAHPLVYHAKSQRVFLFGGNPDLRDAMSTRLDDFWELRLHRPTVDDVVRDCVFQLRRQRFIQLCQSTDNLLDALCYLQTEVTQVVDPTSAEQVQALASLSMHLFTTSPKPSMDQDEPVLDSGNNGFQARSELYDRVSMYFPRDMKQPEGSLVDYVPMC